MHPVLPKCHFSWNAVRTEFSQIQSEWYPNWVLSNLCDQDGGLLLLLKIAKNHGSDNLKILWFWIFWTNIMSQLTSPEAIAVYHKLTIPNGCHLRLLKITKKYETDNSWWTTQWILLKKCVNLGPVVQSIVSLTSSLRGQLVNNICFGWEIRKNTYPVNPSDLELWAMYSTGEFSVRNEPF